MTWEAVSAVVGVVTGFVVILGVFIRLSIGWALADFKSELIEALDKRYVTRMEWDMHRSEDYRS